MARKSQTDNPCWTFTRNSRNQGKLLMSSYLHGIHHASTIENESAYQIVSVCSLFYQPISWHALLSISFSPKAPLRLRRRRRILIQYPLLHQLLRLRSLLQLLLQTIRSHMLLQFPLLSLYRRRGIGVGKDIP